MATTGERFSSRLFNRRLERCREKLFRMAYAWSHNRYLAEDLTQQALVKALEKRAQLRDPEKLEQWVYMILANTLRDWHRQERRLEPLDDYHVVEEKGPDRHTAETEIVHRVRRAVAQLPLAQRQVLTLVDLEGCAYADVATILDIPIGTVMSRLSRARQALRGRLEILAKETLGAAAADQAPRLKVVR